MNLLVCMCYNKCIFLLYRMCYNQCIYVLIRYLYNVLSKNQVVQDSNRGLLVETLRSIAEILIWGDQNDSSVFEWVRKKYRYSSFVMWLCHVVCVSLHYSNSDHYVAMLQFLSGEEYAVILPAHHETEVWQLRMCPVATDAKHTLREHTQWDITV